MTDSTNHDTSQVNDNVDADGVGDGERGSEVSDFVGDAPLVDPPAAAPAPSGYGAGDIADVDDDETIDTDDDAVEAVELTPEEVATLIAERDQFRDAAVRWQADFENYRKRAQAQTVADVDRATGRIAEALLPVLDAAETAFVSHPDEVGPLFNALLAELRRQGLETFDLEGQAFDPTTAEAVNHEPGEGGETVIAEVLRSGYSWKGKTLRPAMVRTTD